MKWKILCISLVASICIYAQDSKVLSAEGKKHYNAAMTLFDMASNINDYMSVAKEFEAVINSDPNYADTYYNLGRIYTRLGKEYGESYLQKAKDAFNKYKQLRPAEASTADDELYTINLLQTKAANRAKKNAMGYIDLGLPSETFWKANNVAGYYTYEEAVARFGNNLPTKEQWVELVQLCTWTWKGNGYTVTGPNGNSIFFSRNGDS